MRSIKVRLLGVPAVMRQLPLYQGCGAKDCRIIRVDDMIVRSDHQNLNHTHLGKTTYDDAR